MISMANKSFEVIIYVTPLNDESSKIILPSMSSSVTAWHSPLPTGSSSALSNAFDDTEDEDLEDADDELEDDLDLMGLNYELTLHLKITPDVIEDYRNYICSDTYSCPVVHIRYYNDKTPVFDHVYAISGDVTLTHESGNKEDVSYLIAQLTLPYQPYHFQQFAPVDPEIKNG